ncbi:hypothetical protein [Solimonas terrae]|uniref:DUF1761 domain-containing protein n=1 Tax=Solimonas terrae TaxID=1396819 RepID=A0A6M2BPS4_9GAMM|nr:hypothetical protein [Solimonas terrae]NGY04079.1 hypothetical protein [Solimonas terrae]
MISIIQLWLPILVSAVGVFVASSLVHMVFKWHNADYLKLTNEDEVAAALRKSGAPPGQYVIPHCLDMKDLQTQDMQQKFQEGPVGYINLRPNGMPNMGKSLGQWFALSVLISLLAAIVAGAALPIGAVRCSAFIMTGLLAFAAYGCGSISGGIWKGQTWISVFRDLLDAVIYGAVTGGVFAWLWPH